MKNEQSISFNSVYLPQAKTLGVSYDSKCGLQGFEGDCCTQPVI